MQDLNRFFETRSYPVALGLMIQESVERNDEPFTSALLEELEHTVDVITALECCLDLEVA